MAHVIEDVVATFSVTTSTGTVLEFKYVRYGAATPTLTRKLIPGPGAGTVPMTVDGLEADILQLRAVAEQLRKIMVVH